MGVLILDEYESFSELGPKWLNERKEIASTKIVMFFINRLATDKFFFKLY